MKKLIKYILLVVAMSFSSAIVAADLIDVFEQSLQSDPIFQAAQSQRMSVREALPQAISYLLPNLSGTANSTYNYAKITQATPAFIGQDPLGTTKYNSNGYTVTLTQPLIAFTNWMQVRKAGNTAQEADATFAAALQDLMIRVARAYFDVLLAQEKLRYAQAELAENKLQLHNTTQRYNVGMDRITNLYDAQAAHDRTTANEIAAANDLRNSHEALRQLTGQTYAVLETFKTVLPLLEPKPFNIEQWVGAAVKQNLVLQAKRFNMEAARENIKVNYGGHMPTVSVVSNYGTVRGANFGDVNSNQGSVALQLNMPIFQGGLVNSQTRQAQYDFQTASANRENTYRSVIVTTRQKYNDVLAGIGKIKADRATVTSAQASLTSTEEGHKVGVNTIVEVLIARRTLYDAKRVHANDQYNYLMDTLLLKQAAGTLSPKDLQEINVWLHQHIVEQTPKKKLEQD